jgi:hypothetical protein
MAEEFVFPNADDVRAKVAAVRKTKQDAADEIAIQRQKLFKDYVAMELADAIQYAAKKIVTAADDGDAVVTVYEQNALFLSTNTQAHTTVDVQVFKQLKQYLVNQGYKISIRDIRMSGGIYQTILTVNLIDAPEQK